MDKVGREEEEERIARKFCSIVYASFRFFVYSPERMRATRFCKVGLLRYANDPHATQKRINDDQKEIIVPTVSDDLRITENDKRGGGMLRDIYP